MNQNTNQQLFPTEEKNYKATEDQDALLAWAQIDFLNQNRISKLRNHFGDLKTAWEKGSEKDFIQAGISAKSTKIFFERRLALDFDKTKKIVEKLRIKLIFIEDENYPPRLLEISAPPIFLFVRGEILPQDDLSFAIVGTRDLTSGGKQSIAFFTPHLVKAGFTIVSGLARGVDTYAHKETLNSNGRTLAILGSGVDNIWPSENIALADKIINGCGAAISEFPIGTEPLAFNFPRRNRIISGLCVGVLIVEGREKSGSLITAQIALEQNKEVFAIPGSPFAPLSAGPNLLIKKGEAKLVQTSEDILNEFSLEQTKSENQIKRDLPANENEKKILEIIINEPKMFDEIVILSDMNTAIVSSTLTILEMKGRVRNLGMGQWTCVF